MMKNLTIAMIARRALARES